MEFFHFSAHPTSHPYPIKLIITTTCMLMGINVPNAHIVINLGAMANLSDGVQASGRVGRRDGTSGKTRPVGLMYNILNGSDMSKHTSTDVKTFMASKDCLSKLLKNYFGWQDASNCAMCSNCIL